MHTLPYNSAVDGTRCSALGAVHGTGGHQQGAVIMASNSNQQQQPAYVQHGGPSTGLAIFKLELPFATPSPPEGSLAARCFEVSRDSISPSTCQFWGAGGRRQGPQAIVTIAARCVARGAHWLHACLPSGTEVVAGGLIQIASICSWACLQVDVVAWQLLAWSLGCGAKWATSGL